MKLLMLICAFGMTANLSFADEFNLIIDSPSQMVCKILQDPKTKVIFYLESDRHHLSAISPKGTLLWQMDTWADNWADFFKALAPKPVLSRDQIKSFALINFIDLYKPNTLWAALRLENFGVKHREDYLTVSFNGDTFGLIKKSTGEFTFLLKN